MAKKRKRIDRLTVKDRASLRPWAQRWIDNAMSTRPMNDADRAAMTVAINGLYDAAKLARPRNIVFAPGPVTGGIAAGVAAAASYAGAYAAAHAAAYAAAHAATARAETLKQCADIVRKYYPTPPRL